MRVRSKVTQPETFEKLSTLGSWPSETNIVTAYDTCTMKDVVSERFTPGSIVNNPCEYSRVALSSKGTGRFESRTTNGSLWVSKTGPVTREQVILRGLSYPEVDYDYSALLDDSRNKAVANMDTTPLETGEDVAEFGETMRFLRRPLQSIFDILKAGGAFNKTKRLADLWLTYRFALTPLVRSLHDICTEITLPSPTPPDIRVAHGRASGDTYKREVIDPKTSGSLVFDYESSRSVKVHTFIQYRVNGFSPSFRWRYGLRGKDILPTFWAVMPYSFMVDRIIDISSLVKATQNLLDPSLVILGAGTTIHDGSETTYRFVKENPVPGWTSSTYGEYSILNRHRFSRSSWVPSVQFPPVAPLGLVDDITKVADLCALLTQGLRR